MNIKNWYNSLKQVQSVVDTLKGFENISNVANTANTEVAAALTKKYANAVKGLTKEQAEFALTMSGVEATEQLATQLELLASNPLTWIALYAAALVGLSKAYDKFTVSTKESSEMLDSSLTASKNKVKEVREQKDNIDQLAESYEKLSKGVNTSTNENISLTTDSYKEYLDVCNQIADIYPDLVTGYDAQGNAILSLKGNIDELTDSYKKAQQEAYATAYLGELDEDGNRKGGIKEAARLFGYKTNEQGVFDGFWAWAEGANTANKRFNTNDKRLEEAKNLLSYNDDELKTLLETLTKDTSGGSDLLSEMGITLQNIQNQSTDQLRSTIQLFINDINSTEEEAITDVASTLEGYMKGVTEAGSSSLMSGYDKLTERQQNLATSLLSSLDKETVQSFTDSGDFEGAAKKWVDNLVSSVSNMSAEAKNAYNQLQDSIAHPDDLMASDINQLDKYLDTLSNNLKISKDKLKEIFNLDDIFDTETSFSNKLNELLNSTFDSADLDAANDALDNYKEVIQEAQNLGLDLSQTVFGNIDTNNRQVLEWTNDTLNQYKDALQSWDEEALNNWDQFASDMKGSISTVFGSSAEYDGVEIAFSPMLQTENGAVLLSSDTVDTYINSLISNLGKNWNNEDLLALDAKGLDIDGTHIKNLIADIGDTAIQTGEAMHYMGQDGAIALAARNVEEYSDVLKDSIDVTSSAQKANDSNSQSLSKSTKSIKTNSQAIKWMKENCDQMTLSQKKMFLEAATDAQSPLETIQKFHDLIANNALNSLSVDISNVTDHITNLNTALSESASATGLTSDSITNLKNMFSGLDDYDESKLFENTANGIKLNREELEKLNKAYDGQNRKDIAEQLDTLTDSYNDLTEQIDNCNNVADLPNLYSQRDAILDQIDNVQSLASQYDGLTSAYNEWVNAQNETSPGASYDSMYSYLETANELASEGKWGNPALQKFLKLLTGEDMSEKTGMQMKEIWENLDKPIRNTGHNLMEFLTEGEEGSQAFIDTLKKLDDKYVQLDEDGNISFNIDNMSDLADKMGTDISFVQILLDKLSEYGYKIHVDSTDLDLTKTKAEEANEALNESLTQKGQETYTFNFDADTDSIETEVKKAEEMYNSIKAGGDTEDLQHISVIYTQLLAQREALNRPIIMQINTEKLDDTQKKAITTFQTLQNCIDGYQVAIETGTDTTDLRASIEETLDTFDTVSDDIKEKLGMNSEEFKNAIKTLKQNLSDGVELDDGAISTIEDQFKNIDPEILAKIGIDTSSMNDAVDSTTQAIQDALTNVLNGIHISWDWDTMSVKITADTSDLDSAVENSNNEVDNMHTGKATVVGDTSDADNKVGETKSSLVELSSTPWKAVVQAFVYGAAAVSGLLDTLKNGFQKAGAGIYNAVASVNSYSNGNKTANYGTTTTKKSTGFKGSSGGHTFEANGTFHGFAEGTFLRGYGNGTNVAIQKDQKAVINEVGTEAVLRDGVLTEIPGGAQTIDLKRGDVIFNHLQLEQLKRNGYVTANGGHGKLIGGFAYGTLNGLSGYAVKAKKQYGAVGTGIGTLASLQSSKNYGNFDDSSKKKSSGNSTKSGSKSSSGSSTKSSSGSSSTDTSSSAEETKETLDWIEIKISRVERLILNLGKTVSATYKSWSERNTALSSELSQVNSEISIQQQAYNRYMQEANNVGLDAGYAQKVRDGKIDIETITDDDLKEKINLYKEYYEKALDASDAILDLKDNLYDLAQTNFDNITKQFEEQLDVITHSVNMVEGYIDLAETRGYLASTEYYDNLIKLETQNMGTLKNELDSLTNTLNNMVNTGQIKKYSEAWYDLYGQICDVEEALQDATKALSEYESKMRELKWSYFEKEQDYITNFTDEMSWLNELLEKQGKLIDDNGNLTDRGTASMGLHAVGYNTYMSQADDYAKEIQKINEELAKDPFNTILIDKRQEYLKAQRDSIDAAYDEIDAAKSLMKDGYDAQIDALNKLIELKKKNMDAEKSLYDYQSSVAEKVTNISSLEKQRKAYEHDNSEEGMSKRQQLDKSIKDAKTDLQETEWEQQISDVQNLLDTLSSDYEEFLNQRLDDINFILNTMLDSANQNSESIKTTLTDATASVGTTLSETMNTVWTSSSGLNGIVTSYGNGFNNALTTTNKALASIEAMIKSMVQEAQKKAAEDAAKQAAAAKAAQAQTPTVNSNSNNNSNQNKSNNTNKSNGNFFIHKVDSYPKNRLNVNSSIVDFS